MNIKKSVKAARTGFWHLRQGGLPQLWKWAVPRLVAKGMMAPSLGPWDVKSVQDYVPLELTKSYGHLKVAAILDDFSLAAWGGEFDLLQVRPSTWQEQLEEQNIDLLLVESAWNGNHGAWQYKLTGPNAPGPELVDLVKYCRKNSIPTVFWNKEDPPHFEDFLTTAKLFDAVFTSDSNRIAAYEEELGHDRIQSMAFAAAPAIHNPVRGSWLHQEGDVAFAGMYFAHKFTERRQQMELLLDAAVQVGPRMAHGLTIFSRFQGHDERYQFPALFDRFVVGSLPYQKMLTAYRGFKVFLNVNSVVESPSMCARRIFEITASGTPVITTPSKAISNFFPPEEVTVVETHEQAQLAMRALVNSPQLRDRMVHKAQRRIWREHTYSHRASQVLEAAGIDHEKSSLPTVSVMVSTNRPHQIEHVLTQVAHQQQVEMELLLLCHGFEPKHDMISRRCVELGIQNYKILEGPASWSLGACLNKIVEESSGQVLAKFDDDDFYGPNYLLDQLNALNYSGAGLVGKECSYLYDAETDVIIRRRPEREHIFTRFVAGPTLVGFAEVFRAHPFADRSTGEDTEFLRDLVEGDVKIYAADRFNFLQMRNKTGHTWSVSGAELLANGVVEVIGLHIDQVIC
ncbi:glycosyltransferase [Corynebacterium glutamicum]|uniref:glycosyltransferase n=1 Tax=Corynebacterium glutamicum TaxID=1718 RepID=UPI00058A6308|nr:glycosyltransferase [Corynebacterium glutamicum]AJE66427.1 glycosyltransferase [Corynebacterium glutamicum]OKX93070.1 glycosyltransferase [Corynebacterium glutamicum]TWS33449.1 glycosyltransferase [Corynebacterium glutamicum]